jgi:hypothetical protein
MSALRLAGSGDIGPYLDMISSRYRGSCQGIAQGYRGTWPGLHDWVQGKISTAKIMAVVTRLVACVELFCASCNSSKKGQVVASG